MSRNLSDQLKQAAHGSAVKLIMFAELALDSGTLYLHTNVGEQEFDGHTWSGLGDFGGISAIQESDELKSYDVTLVLSGLDANMLNEVLNQDYFGRAVTLYIGALDVDTNELVHTPDIMWSGFMDAATITAGRENTINIQCENEFSIFSKSNGSAFSDADLQAKYPGDLMFEFLPSMTDAVVVWRGEAATTGTRDFEPDASSKNSKRGNGFDSADDR